MEKSVRVPRAIKHWVCATLWQGELDVHTEAVGADSHPGGRSACAVSIMARRETLELQTVSPSGWTPAREFDKAVTSVQYFY